MRVEGVSYNKRPWWHGKGPYFVTMILIVVLAVVFNQTTRNEYRDILQEERKKVAEMQKEVDNLQHQADILEEALSRRIRQVNELLYEMEQMAPNINYTQDEMILLEKLVTAEARGEGYEGMLAVANVVINRALSEKFPHTIIGVINQKNQFCPVRTGAIHRAAPDETAKQAVADALKGYRAVTADALFFYNPGQVSHGHWIRTRKTVTDIGNHRFAM